MSETTEEVGVNEAAAESPKRHKARKSKRNPASTLRPGATKTHHTQKKDAIALDPEVAKKARKLRAQLELKTGERVTLSDAVEYALSKYGLK